MNLIVLFLALVLPPEATEIPHEITAHGQTRVDDFYWMNNIEDPAVLEYLQAENEYTDSLMAGSSELIETIAMEITNRMRTDEASVPYYRNDYWYWYEYLPEQEYAINMRKAHPDGEPEILLNENIYSKSHDYFSVETISVSPDNRTVAWAYDTTGGHWNTLVFQDISSGDTLDIINGCAGTVAWASDSRMVFFGLKDETGRTDRIMRKTIGCDDMTMVYFEEDPTFWPWVSNSQDREWILIGSASSLETEYRIVPASHPVDSLLLIHPRTDDLEYYVYPFDSTLYINTNLNGENFSIMRASADSPGIENWKTVVPHDPSALITDLDIFDDILAVSMLSEGQKKLFLADPATGSGRYADLGEESATFYTTGNYSPEADSIRLVYTSLTTPWSTIAYDLNHDSVRVLKTQFAGEGFSQSDYESIRLMAPAADGELVPMGMVYRKDMLVPGENPLLLYGYGAYGMSLEPMFNSTMLSLLDRGFIFVNAHIRGGSEMGRRWYDMGRTVNKMNTFTDFITCAEYLIDQNWCDSERVFAMGESAGGLLMGAVTNMRPDLWRGVVAGVPFVDALTTMLDPSLPLTTNEYDEWGNPADYISAYEYILSYSPMDNLAEVEYPAMYVFTGVNDSQVGYWEPAKWIAGIRRVNTGNLPVMLRVNMGSGHGGASGRYGWIGDTAEKYAFLLVQAGLN
ncbi:oligopeptidase B [Candidatus Fermentibacteria bacterium]|nr:MAG: oligopeptidase B [Candidatus Fermentibacteria bacterium]